MNTNSSMFKATDRPVERVNWFDCIVFCNKLSEQEGLEKVYDIPKTLPVKLRQQIGKSSTAIDTLYKDISYDLDRNGYRLPTEAEWEYCARSDQQFLYSGDETIDAVGWIRDNSEKRTHPVGQKKANGFGLYDMSGNVWEWCWDSWIRDYTTATQKDPVFIKKDSRSRIFRGGSWSDEPLEARNANRGGNFSTHRSSRVGFRFLRMVV